MWAALVFISYIGLTKVASVAEEAKNPERNIHGLDFPMAKQTIHAVFLLLGNRDNPTQHLRFLAEIARRAENPHFIDNWIAADSVDDLASLLISKEE